mmetsp:Transcript_12528/g.29415  ORF Transcript_12528/g.29415 Transcript_12528/m.29415 type:complete len:226 (+) Transcript_12528:340-1017(+)
METAVQQLCMPGVDTIWKWCDTWMMVKVGSLIMVLFGFMLVGLLASGGACMYYYAYHHSTYNGRMAALVCFIAAPACAVVGLLQYTVLTYQMGSGEREFVETEASYGPGFFFACTLTIFTFVPLYIQVTFSKADLFEKYSDDDEIDTGVVYASGYGATTAPVYVPTAPLPSNVSSGPSGNFGLPPAQVPGPMVPVSVGLGLPMPPGPFMGPGPMAPVPGSGAPAW